jgi:uncharacterized protein (UPF0332 family)
MSILPVRISGRDISLHKAIMQPAFGLRTVLANSPWSFVGLWLKRNRKEDAVIYWEQAQNFYNAAIGLPLRSAPLLLYYSYMNAAKALLSSKGIEFDPKHGVGLHNMRGPHSKISLSNEGVRVYTRGVLASLSSYYQETESTRDHSLQELFFNMTFIHRTYCLTYKSQREMFIPLRECRYVFDKQRGVAFLQAPLAADFSIRQIQNTLPPSLTLDQTACAPTIRSVREIAWSNADPPAATEIADLISLHQQLRADLNYIHASQTLWYAFRSVSGPPRLHRRSVTLVLAAMHRLSEICRYRPRELASYLEGQRNWLLSVFIEMSPIQFLDEIAAELTGHQIMIPNVRVPG